LRRPEAGDRRRGSFFTRPISGTLLTLIGVFIAWQVIAPLFKPRNAVLDPAQT